jgi:serine O-acetyltransferase
MAAEFENPAGWRGVRGDFAHYCTIHRAATRLDRLLLPLRAPSLLALAVYRFGAWLYRKPRPPLGWRVLYALLFEAVRHATGILIHRWAEIDERVWLESHAPILLGARRVARGTRIYGGVSLGSGGTRERRGVPSIGRNVVIGPGAAVVGPVEIPDDAVIGPNTLITSSPSSGAWLGSPPMRWRRDPQLLVPA